MNTVLLLAMTLVMLLFGFVGGFITLVLVIIENYITLKKGNLNNFLNKKDQIKKEIKEIENNKSLDMEEMLERKAVVYDKHKVSFLNTIIAGSINFSRFLIVIALFGLFIEYYDKISLYLSNAAGLGTSAYEILTSGWSLFAIYVIINVIAIGFNLVSWLLDKETEKTLSELLTDSIVSLLVNSAISIVFVFLNKFNMIKLMSMYTASGIIVKPLSEKIRYKFFIKRKEIEKNTSSK